VLYLEHISVYVQHIINMYVVDVVIKQFCIVGCAVLILCTLLYSAFLLARSCSVAGYDTRSVVVSSQRGVLQDYGYATCGYMCSK
jgi:hypothetical protein